MSRTSTERDAPTTASGRPPTRTASGTQRTLVEVGAALIVALGSVLIARDALGVESFAASLAVAYLGFVATVAIAEFAGRSGDDASIDLVAEEQFEQAENSPILAVPLDVRAEPTLDDIPCRDIPIRRKRITRDDVVEFVIAAVASFGVVELIRIGLHMRSLVGFAIWWYVAFIAIYFLLARDRSDAEVAVDRVVTVVVWSIGMLVVGELAWMVVFIVAKGLHRLSWSFFTQDLSKTGPLDPGGGAKHAIIGTLEQVGLAAFVVVPVGILTAVYLHEVRGRLAGVTRFIVDAMSGLPSIVAGLLIYTIWVQGHGYSGIAGSAALAILMLPTMTRASEVILRTVPDTLREGALALGAPHHRLVRRVVLPTAMAGLVTATLLAIARAIGETAPMLLTAFGADGVNTDPLRGPQSDLPLFVYKLIFLPNKAQNERAYTGALILVILVFVFFAAARLVSNRGQRKLEGTRR